MTEMKPLRRLQSVKPQTDETLTVDQRTTAALVASSRGDEAAFSAFYDLTSKLVYGIVVKVVRDPAMAEEVTQEVYVELWRLAPRYDPTKGSAKSWTATVAHRRAVDLVRSEQARRTRDQQDVDSRGVPFDQVVETVVDRLDRSEVERGLDLLSESQRDAVTMAYYGGRTYREVAALLNVPEGTVKTRIRDGLIKLRDQFGVTV